VSYWELLPHWYISPYFIIYGHVTCHHLLSPATTCSYFTDSSGKRAAGRETQEISGTGICPEDGSVDRS